MTKTMTGAQMVIQALKDQGVDTIFGYPGGAVLPIYDEIFQQNDIKHILMISTSASTVEKLGEPLDIILPLPSFDLASCPAFWVKQNL